MISTTRPPRLPGQHTKRLVVEYKIKDKPRKLITKEEAVTRLIKIGNRIK